MTRISQSKCGVCQQDGVNGTELAGMTTSSFLAELSYQRYILKDWQYFPVTNGK